MLVSKLKVVMPKSKWSPFDTFQGLKSTSTNSNIFQALRHAKQGSLQKYSVKWQASISFVVSDALQDIICRSREFASNELFGSVYE